MYAIRSYYDTQSQHDRLLREGSGLVKLQVGAQIGRIRCNGLYYSHRITSYNVCYTKLLREAVSIGKKGLARQVFAEEEAGES